MVGLEPRREPLSLGRREETGLVEVMLGRWGGEVEVGSDSRE